MKKVLIQNGFETMTAISILARINRSEIQVEPYPYIHVPDALDADYYRELAGAYPSLLKVAGKPSVKHNTAHLLSARDVIDDLSIPAIWREFFEYHASTAFFREMVDFWRPIIDQVHLLTTWSSLSPALQSTPH